MILATEIIKEQREKIEEQIKFYEDMCKALLADAERMSNKAKNLREYLDKNWHCSRSAVAQRFKKIKKFLNNT